MQMPFGTVHIIFYKILKHAILMVLINSTVYGAENITSAFGIQLCKKLPPIKYRERIIMKKYLYAESPGFYVYKGVIPPIPNDFFTEYEVRMETDKSDGGFVTEVIGMAFPDLSEKQDICNKLSQYMDSKYGSKIRYRYGYDTTPDEYERGSHLRWGSYASGSKGSDFNNVGVKLNSCLEPISYLEIRYFANCYDEPW